MATYSYRAKDRNDREVLGRIEARDADEARRLVEEQGLIAWEVRAAETADTGAAPPIELSRSEAEQVAEQVSLLGKTGFPLAPGLRAVAEESDSPRLAQALCWLAQQIEQGRSLEEALVSSQQMLPRHMRGLIAAAVRTGQLGPAMSELAEHQRAAADLRRNMFNVLTYPALVLGLALAIFAFVSVYITGGFKRIYDDFGTRLPALTQALLWWHDKGIWLLLALLIVLALVAALTFTRWFGGPVAWRRLLAALPMVGPLWRLSSLAEWSGLLEVLIRHQVTLPEALRMAAGGVSNPYVAQISLAIAEGVSRGRSLSQMLAAQGQIPTSLVPLVRWGEKAGDLADSLGVGREMLEERVRMRSFWLHTITPPVLFLVIGSGIALVVVALFMPLISLISNLSGGG